ncbi:LamG-like jellyroll fold domain-containing protein [Paenarthrobacter sp.]|uniref:LamG-like jellyroll fold domain-containing protein n=1 Tax=Paenarthrobacter sp. TaxID=1931993 RepID=UPI00281204E8|nr:LamG-like jellyroll fold domain-containing protein [Paenarthrobacter sp.]
MHDHVLDAVWVHLTGVYDSANGRARFLNGFPASEDGVITDPIFAAKGPPLFGRAQAHRPPVDFFDGTITDVRTWPRALDTKGISAAAMMAAPEGAALDRPASSAASTCPDPMPASACVTWMAARTRPSPLNRT